MFSGWTSRMVETQQWWLEDMWTPNIRRHLEEHLRVFGEPLTINQMVRDLNV